MGETAGEGAVIQGHLPWGQVFNLPENRQVENLLPRPREAGQPQIGGRYP
jgi:hypothetical protein